MFSTIATLVALTTSTTALLHPRSITPPTGCPLPTWQVTTFHWYNGMVNVCWTGMPNYQPWGYGPPETLDIDFADGLTCHDEYIGYRVHDIGNGASNCGYADRGEGRIVSFYGSSDYETSTGRMDYVLGDGHALECTNGSRITYQGSTEFTLTCTHDADFNATCTAPVFEIPVLSWEWVS
ncbi:uncharacterized protein BO80DRAFT_494636 [Aspergillus ibericus CBS 121593]|uniref:AA1-like domain-containing protein n=1 Tax=Aspergillus ibericus CBS 121593 TaxID=1448316 RepID=A0A395GVM8_9EURO|nr:hypothetical protein BO80DRAFT_494636 [Aspergillus ibericus CBS 121593]RAK99630.1 hypothetical protein BO80DRAFT_494636 [Aspergillus ibericus CBS 121593]